MSVSQKTSRSGTIFFAVAILIFVGFGYGALKSYFDQRTVTENLVTHGVETEADVRSVTTTRTFRGGASTSIGVSFDPRGPELITFADVQVCTEANYEEGTETVRIVYAPNDPEAVRLAECVSSVDSQLGLIVGVLFLALGAFLLWLMLRR